MLNFVPGGVRPPLKDLIIEPVFKPCMFAILLVYSINVFGILFNFVKNFNNTSFFSLVQSFYSYDSWFSLIRVHDEILKVCLNLKETLPKPFSRIYIMIIFIKILYR